MNKLGKFAVALAMVFSIGAAMAEESAANDENRYYIAKNGSDANDGKSWGTAWASLAHALEKAEDESTVVFDDGEYSFENVLTTITIDRPLTITSRNGRDETTLYFTFGANVRALTLKDAKAVMSGITLKSNKNNNSGGGALSITAGRFEDGAIIGFSCARAASTGVAASLSGGMICNTVISNNYTHTSGGSGQYGALVLAGGNAVADRCTIVDNEVPSTTSTTANHGAVFVASGTSLRNSLVARNKKPNKNSGVSIAKNGVVDNCTIVGNACGSTTDFGGVYAASGAIIRNTVIAGNTNQGGERNFTLLDSGAKLSNCCSTTDLRDIDQSNRFAQPEFVDAANGDYRLAGGVCVNNGARLDWMDGEALDLDGKARILGAGPEIGCYEYMEGALKASAVVSAVYGVDELEVTLTASVLGADQDGLVYNWYLSGGEEPDVSGEDKAEINWTYDQPGVFNVRLVVTNGAGERSEASYEKMVTVSPNTVYVSKDSTPQVPYGSWETAAGSLQEALSVARDGTTVVLGDGVYTNANITKAIVIDAQQTITSRNGREKTTLYFTYAGSSRALALKHAQAVVSGITLASNRRATDGSTTGSGALDISAGRFENGAIVGFSCSRAASWGVAVTMDGGVICDTVISNNYMYSSGGSAQYAVLRLEGGKAVAERCTIVDNEEGSNESGANAGCVYVANGTTIRNSLIARNSKPNLNSGLCVQGGGIVDNCTVVGNKCMSSMTAGGVYAASGAVIRNTIVSGNVNMNGEQNFTTLDAGAKITNCCSPDDLTGNGTNNVVAVPEFVDYDHGDYHLASGACINGGAVLDWMDTDSTDLDGGVRIRGDRPDIGCYETEEGPLKAAAVVSATYGVEELDVTLTASIVGDCKEGLEYFWYLSGGNEPDVSGADKTEIDWSYTQPGVYTVRLVVTNADGERSEAVYDDMVTVSPRTVYVAKNSTPARPYGSWETAANSVLDALKVAGDGTTVIVGDGVYTNDDTIIVTKDMRFVSRNGRDKTVMTRVNSGVKLLDVGCPTATVEGFTFRQEKYGSAMKGTAFSIRSGVVTNCAFRDVYNDANVASLSGGAVVDCLVDHCRGAGRTSLFTSDGGTFDRCVFSDNNLDFSEYGGFSCETAHTYRNCLFAGNHCGDGMTMTCGAIITVKAGSVFENCTVVSNRIATASKSKAGATRPAVIANGTVRNCIIWGNANPFDINDVSTSATVTYTLSGNAELDGVDGNICADPLFYSPGSGKFRLREKSPAVDAGTNQTWMTGARDLNGNARIYHEELGGIVDMGCYERIPCGFMMLVK